MDLGQRQAVHGRLVGALVGPVADPDVGPRGIVPVNEMEFLDDGTIILRVSPYPALHGSHSQICGCCRIICVDVPLHSNVGRAYMRQAGSKDELPSRHRRLMAVWPLEGVCSYWARHGRRRADEV